jgi:peroxiredoxin
MRNVSYLLIGLSAVLLSLGSCINDDEDFEGIEVGDRLPAFSLPVDIADESDWRFSASPWIADKQSMEGKINIIVFFNTACKDCRNELPVLQQLYDMIKADDAYCMMCISREEPEEEVKNYWKNNYLTLPFCAQNDRQVYSLFAASVIPRVYITDKNGVVTHIFTDSPVAELSDLLKAINSYKVDFQSAIDLYQ